MTKYREGHIVLSSGVPVRIKEMWVTPGMWIVEYKNGDTVGVAETDLEPLPVEDVWGMINRRYSVKVNGVYTTKKIALNNKLSVGVTMTGSITPEVKMYFKEQECEMRYVLFAHEFQDLLYYAFNIEI